MNTVQEYLDWLDQISGSKGKIYDIGGKELLPQIFVAIYDQIPELEHKTAYSFGLSSVPHEEWRSGRPELVISVRSSDDSWGLAMGEIIKEKRDAHLFEYGSVFNFGERISDESEMSAFLVFANSLFDPGDERAVFSDRTISLSQLYPIYAEEWETIHQIGAEAFYFEREIDFFDVRRKRVLK